MLIVLGAIGAVPFLAVSPPAEVSQARTAVFGFAAALLAAVAGVGSLAKRETLVRSLSSGDLDPESPTGIIRVRRTLVAIWFLCEIVAALGVVLVLSGKRPVLLWPHWIVAAVLLFFHAPRARLLRSHVAPASAQAV